MGCRRSSFPGATLSSSRDSIRESQFHYTRWSVEADPPGSEPLSSPLQSQLFLQQFAQLSALENICQVRNTPLAISIKVKNNILYPIFYINNNFLYVLFLLEWPASSVRSLSKVWTLNFIAAWLIISKTL